jgi:hypothetical protein
MLCIEVCGKCGKVYVGVVDVGVVEEINIFSIAGMVEDDVVIGGVVVSGGGMKKLASTWNCRHVGAACPRSPHAPHR